MGRVPLPEERAWFLSEGLSDWEINEIFKWYPDYGGILYQNRDFFEKLKKEVTRWSSFFGTFVYHMGFLSKMITSRETLEVVCGYLLDLCRLLGDISYMKTVLYKEVKSLEDLKKIVEFEKKKARTIWLKSHKYPAQPDKIWLEDPLSCLIYDNQDIFLQIEEVIGTGKMKEFCELLIEFKDKIKTRANLELVKNIIIDSFINKRVAYNTAHLRDLITQYRGAGTRKAA